MTAHRVGTRRPDTNAQDLDPVVVGDLWRATVRDRTLLVGAMAHSCL
ncbi:MAG: hypothetical protein OSB42_02955 [Planctomycetota bacterium]|nr:hypothetical protein [Planctomycetota bacterium]